MHLVRPASHVRTRFAAASSTDAGTGSPSLSALPMIAGCMPLRVANRARS